MTLVPQFVFDTLSPMSVRYTFSENVGPTLATSDFAVQNQTTATAVADANKAIAYNTIGNFATLTFPGFTNGVLPDGNYENTILPANIADLAGNPLQTGSIFDYVFLGADANRDRKVDLTDSRSSRRTSTRRARR